MSRKDKPKVDPSSLKRILLIRLRRIGDVVMTTPAVAALKEALPQASIDYVVEEPYRRLVEGHPHIVRTISLPPRQRPAEFLRFIRRLRRERYDALIDFHGGPRAWRIAFLARAGVKVGYELKHKSCIYDVRLPRSPKCGYYHSVENHLNLVKALGVKAAQAPPLSLPAALPEEIERVKKFWAEYNLGDRKVVVLHIGAGNDFRDWGAENLAALAKMLADEPETKIILAGSLSDEERAKDLLGRSAAPLLSLVGQVNLIELREFISRAALFVGPDSGPMHIAATTATPIVALFGPTLPANFAPWQARATLMEKDLDCRPCRQIKCLTADFRCLKSITPAEVFNACCRYLLP